MSKLNQTLKMLLGTLTAGAMMVSQAQISQTPLLTQKGSVEPNLVLSLDTSGSMESQFSFRYGGNEGWNGRNGPENIADSSISGTWRNATCTGPFSITGTCTYNTPASNKYWFLSPDVNSLTYDPRIRYKPRVDSTGTVDVSGSTAVSAAAVTTSTATFYVYFYKNGTTGLNETWNGKISNSSGVDQNWSTTNKNYTYNPHRSPMDSSAYFTSGTPAGIPANKWGTNPLSQLADNAEPGLIYPNAVTNSPSVHFPKFVNRTDCTGGTAPNLYCTYANEQLNYATWKKYHSNRLDLVKTGLGWAFDQFGPTLRLGWGTIFDMKANSLNKGVSLLNSAHKSLFYTWLYGRPSTWDGTPNLKAIETMGNYFSRADNKGPWATTPDASSTGSTTLSNVSAGDVRADRKAHMSCRRSYGMLITDGYYDGTTSVGNVDSTAQSTVTGNAADGTALTYTYNGTTRPYPGGGSNTMADITMKYWVTDLRPGLSSDNSNDGIDNKVKTISDTVVASVINKRGNESFWQNMSFYGVGLGVVGTLDQTEGVAGSVLENIRNNVANTNNAGASVTGWPTAAPFQEEAMDDMWHATINGRGRMLSAKNSDTLADGVEGMLADINKDTSSQSGVAASTISLTTATRKYTPSYTTGSWTGNVVSTELDNRGAEQCINWKIVDTATAAGSPSANPYVPPTCSGTTVTYQGIPAHTSRNIYAWNGSAFGSFDSSNSYVNSNIVGANTNLINFLRGDQSNEDTATVNKLYRKRDFLLGDIVNSTPTFVQGALNMKYDRLPAGTYGQATYSAFVAAKTARPEGVLFAGANDGMLHGFRDTTGAEVFAFVPRAVMPNMHLLANRSYNHKYYVDGPTVEADACLTGGSACTTWSNLLLGTAGAGGKTVFALDVTNPMSMTAANIKWEITPATTGYANLGNILSDVQTGLTMGGQWVAVFGNGYYGADGKAHLYVANLDTGALIKDITAGTATSNGLGGIRLVFNNNTTDRRIIGVYAGDLTGKMWKFDLKDTSAANWALGINGSPLYTTSPVRPITAAPTVVDHPNADGSRIVAFGTGKLFDATPDDFSNVDVQSVYGVWDKVAFGAPTTGTAVSGTSTLVLQTISTATTGTNIVTSANGVTSTQTVNYYSVSNNSINWATKNGWYMNLTNTGQRVIYALETLIGRYAAVDTVSPSNLSTNPCTTTGSGKAWNYIIDMTTGGGATVPIFDTNGDGLINTSDSMAVGYENTADGRTRYIKNDSLSTSTAETGYGSTGNGPTGGTVYFTPLSTQQLPGFSIPTPPLPGSISRVRRTWRQVFIR
jgi:type IV pilus assembly protein PilY1